MIWMGCLKSGRQHAAILPLNTLHQATIIVSFYPVAPTLDVVGETENYLMGLRVVSVLAGPV
jgi:hypothetical protein